MIVGPVGVVFEEGSETYYHLVGVVNDRRDQAGLCVLRFPEHALGIGFLVVRTKSCYRNNMTFEGEACDIHELFLSNWVGPSMFCLRCGGEDDLPRRWGIRTDGFYLKHPRARS